jgi:hypothetical protein
MRQTGQNQFENQSNSEDYDRRQKKLDTGNYF